MESYKVHLTNFQSRSDISVKLTLAKQEQTYLLL